MSIVTQRPKKPYIFTSEFRERVYKIVWRILLYGILLASILFSVYLINFTINFDPLFLWASQPISCFTFLVLWFVILDRFKNFRGFLRFLLVVLVNIIFIVGLYKWVTVPANHRMPTQEILSAAKDVCDGKASSDASFYNFDEMGIHPIVLIAEFDKAFESSSLMPFFWKPGFKSTMQTVACMRQTDNPYNYSFVILEAKSGRILDEFTIEQKQDESPLGITQEDLESSLRKYADPVRYNFNPDSKYNDSYYDPYKKDKDS
jgi:hypothetical protein